MDYEKNSHIQAYCGLFKELGQDRGDVQIGPIDYSAYDSGYNIFAFDTSPGHNSSAVPYGKMETGNCELMIHFAKNATKNIVVLVMLEYERKFTLYEMDSGNVRHQLFENVTI